MNHPDKPPEGSFLSRWSRRKSAAKSNEVRDTIQAIDAQAFPAISPTTVEKKILTADHHEETRAEALAGANSSTGAPSDAKAPETPPPEPTFPVASRAPSALPSIEGLTHEADFSPFMAKGVDPGLRNQAMKKLFTDPHYQFAQMDKLDIYIDDYSKSDPIPPEMLRQMVQAKNLFLFDDDEKVAPPQGAEDSSQNAGTTLSPSGEIDAAETAEIRHVDATEGECAPEKGDAENSHKKIVEITGRPSEA